MINEIVFSNAGWKNYFKLLINKLKVVTLQLEKKLNVADMQIKVTAHGVAITIHSIEAFSMFLIFV